MKKEDLKVKFLIGIPAAGKTTWAKAYVKNNSNWTRINRDDFRFMTKDAPVCEPKIEDMITEMVGDAVLTALRYKQNVIIDSTNLKSRYIMQLVKMVEEVADVEYQIFDISIDKAIERDNAREKKVGEAVIKKMFKDYKNLLDSFNFTHISKRAKIYKEPIFDPKLPDAYIFDIDGTTAHMSNKRGPFDWLQVDKDDIDIVIARQIKLHKKNGDKVIFVSGRDESARTKTEEWLQFYGLEYDGLFMRPKDDYRKDSLIKKEIYENVLFGKYNIIAVYDDRDQVVRTWRELGIKVFQVEYGNF